VSAWALLDDELARWQDAGRAPDLWWRDDDAADVTPALARLLDARREAAVPLALAVVPAKATPALAERLGPERDVDLLQHGYGHVNHALPPDKKSELGAHRPAMVVLGDLGTGWMAMERLFAARPLRVLVPPWNRIAPGLVPALPEIGFTGLSAFGPRKRPQPVRGLRQVNTHVDLLDWHGTRGFVGEEPAIRQLVAALAAARSGAGEPVGLLSHHLAMDGDAWDFLRSLWERLRNAKGIKTPTARDLFASGEARG
jgi:hypothetical protein